MSDRSFIETQFPIAPLSVESYRERKAVSGQTLTGLGKWWGRKPLVLVRASIVGMLMPASDDPKKDREVFLKLMTMDPDGVWRRRKGNVSIREILKRAPDFKDAWKSSSKEEREDLLDEIWASLSDEDRADLEAARSFPMAREEFEGLSYDDRIKLCHRPEHMDGPDAEAWADINSHLRTSASTLAELVNELGERRFGHQPRIGDCFCGGGSIPFEAARIGCHAKGSDLNPVAALLTWSSLNIIGGDSSNAERVQEYLTAAMSACEAQVREWGIERNEHGEQADALIYSVEAQPPGSEYFVPLAPSWLVDEYMGAVVQWQRAPSSDRLTPVVEVLPKAALAKFKKTKGATVANGRVLDPFDSNLSWPLESVRGPSGLRRWSNEDLRFQSGDVFAERLYCIRWVDDAGNRRYAAPTPADLAREERVMTLLKERWPEWQEKGFVPSAAIPPGSETDRLPRERGWTRWHHLFHPRQLLVHGLLAEHSLSTEDKVLRAAAMLNLGRLADWDSRLSCWLSSPTQIAGGKNTFLNQALNPLFNYSVRPIKMLKSAQITPARRIKFGGGGDVTIADARDLADSCDIWITDPPYADAVNYHKLGDFFLAWYDKQLQGTFPGWVADARASLAVRGSGDDFKRSMVEIYSNLARHMPDNGLQLVMFTHQNPAVWADLGMILWAAGLRVTAAWTVATETPAGGIKKGNYVQGTVLLVLRKRLSEEHGFLDEVYPMVEDEVRRQIDSMRALDEGGEPNFGDTDYQLAAYAAALRVLTQFQTLDGQDIGHELFRAQDNGGRGRNVEKSRFEQVIDRGIEIACDYLIPRGLDNVWRGLTPDERLYLRALDVESRGEHRQGVYQELARGFGVREFRPLLHTSTANSTRVKTPGEFGRKDLTGDGFGGTQLRQLLFAIHTTRSSETPDAGLRFLKDEVANYWGERQRLIAILDWLAELGRGEAMEHWLADSEAARLLAGRLRGDHG